MSDANRPPTAIRIVRPYQTEDEFLTNELETVGKTSVILIGAHPRPTGIILRFEVVLASGATVLRGEGRVLAHKESAFRGQPGLSLRFTRLDPKSKALVDRAAAMREARLAGEMPSIRPWEPSAPNHPSVEASDRSAPPPPAPAHEPVPVPISFPAPADPALEAALTAATPEPPPPAVLPPIEETPTPPPLAHSIAAAPTPPAPASPANREEILGRLRERAASLSRERVDAILNARKS